MRVMLIVFLVVATLLALATLTYVIVDMVRSAGTKPKSEH